MSRKNPRSDDLSKYIPNSILGGLEAVADEKTFTDFIDVMFSWTTHLINERRYQRTLRKARRNETAEEYVARAGFYATTIAAIVVALVTAIIPLLGNYILGALDITFDPSDISLTIPTELPLHLIPDFITLDTGLLIWLSTFAAENTLVLVQLGMSIVVAPTVWIIVFGLLLYYPSYVSSERERAIDKMLPLAVVYMYGLTKGGRNVADMFRQLTHQEEIYGEVAVEAQTIVNQMHLGQDIRTALDSHSKSTPSDEFRELLEDTVSMMEQGVQADAFFDGKSKDALRAAEESLKQQNELMEVFLQFIIMMQVAPSLMVIMAFVAAMLGTPLTGLLYILPVGIVLLNLILMAVMLLLFGGADPATEKLDIDTPPQYQPNDDIEVTETRIKAFRTSNKISSYLNISFDTILEKPWVSYAITIPLTLAYYVIMFPGVDVLMTLPIEDPLSTLVFYIFIPFTLLFSIYTILYEVRAYKERAVKKEMRSLFGEVREANRQGAQLLDAIDQTVRTRDSTLSNTLKRHLRPSILASPTLVSHSLERTANEYDEPRLRRTIRLITDSMKETGDVTTILDIITKDLRQREEIDRQRANQGSMAAVVMVVCGLIILGLFVLIDVTLISEFEAVGEMMEDMDDGGGQGGAEAVGLDSIPTELTTASMIFTGYATMKMIGLQTGLLRTSNIRAGLKYAIVFSLIAILAFLFI